MHHDSIDGDNGEYVDVVVYHDDDDDNDYGDGAGLERVIGPADGWLGCRPTAEHHSRSCLDFSIMMTMIIIMMMSVTLAPA